jgi:hypothetical protein
MGLKIQLDHQHPKMTPRALNSYILLTHPELLTTINTDSLFGQTFPIYLKQRIATSRAKPNIMTYMVVVRPLAYRLYVFPLIVHPLSLLHGHVKKTSLIEQQNH